MIQNFILKEAIQKPSPNKNPRMTEVKFIVMHYTASWDVNSVINRFADKGSKVSAHVTIGTDGTIYQHVPFNEKAWHAGPSKFGGAEGLNSYALGIEMVNPGFLKRNENGSYTDAYGVVRSADVVGPVVEAKHPIVGSGTYYWPKYTEKQLKSAKDLVLQLLKLYPKISDVLSHEEIDTRGWKTDPGPAFPLAEFKTLTKKGPASYIVTSDSLNVRSGPSTAFAILRTLPQNAVVNFSGVSDGDWFRINNGEWVNSLYLKKV